MSDGDHSNKPLGFLEFVDDSVRAAAGGVAGFVLERQSLTEPLGILDDRLQRLERGGGEGLPGLGRRADRAKDGGRPPRISRARSALVADRSCPPGAAVAVVHTPRRQLPRAGLYVLSGIPGISAATAQALLDRFGSVERFLAAGPDEWAEVNGVGPVRAHALAEALLEHGMSRAEAA